jgi:hypothetical protein
MLAVARASCRIGLLTRGAHYSACCQARNQRAGSARAPTGNKRDETVNSWA